MRLVIAGHCWILFLIIQSDGIGPSKQIIMSKLVRIVCPPWMRNKPDNKCLYQGTEENQLLNLEKKIPFLGISVEWQAQLLTSGTRKIASAQIALTNYGCSTWIQFTLSLQSCLTLGHLSPFFCSFQEEGSCYSLG